MYAIQHHERVKTSTAAWQKPEILQKQKLITSVVFYLVVYTATEVFDSP
jgi:hypothetical protein